MKKDSRKPIALLISPAPIDGYPPVQNQAKILADEGFKVLVASSLRNNSGKNEFSYPNIEIANFSLNSSFISRRLARVKFYTQILQWRLRFQGRIKVEISYDPEGIFYSSIIPFKPELRIAHFHELLFGIEVLGKSSALFYENFSIRVIKKFSLVVAADSYRSEILQKKLGLKNVPLTIRNLPMLQDSLKIIKKPAQKPFSVVYHGSIGTTQALDSIVRSMKFWPEDVKFHVYGTPSSQTLNHLKQLASADKVDSRLVFEGWFPTSEIISHLQKHSVGASFYRPKNDKNKFNAGASNKRYQYMQAGIPQISDTNPGIVELIEENGVGLCVSPDDPPAIAKAVRFFYENEAMSQQYGEKALSLCQTDFYYEKEFLPILDFIRKKGGL